MNSKEPEEAGSEQYWLETEAGGDVEERRQSQKMEAFVGYGKDFGSYSTWWQVTSTLKQGSNKIGYTFWKDDSHFYIKIREARAKGGDQLGDYCKSPWVYFNFHHWQEYCFFINQKTLELQKV